MNSQEIYNQILVKQTFLCIGLDSDIKKIPQHLMGLQDPIFEFNKAIIDATARYAVAYKPNLAFYEENGVAGWGSLTKTIDYLRQFYPEQLIIADAKRGDIGNTSSMYARAFFEQMNVDAITLSPYMGRDTVAPFFEYPGKWAVILALTSNPSAVDFETMELANGQKVYQSVLEKSATWGTVDNTMYVVGATRAEELTAVRAIVPDHFLLIPGVGAQGGSLSEVARYGMNSKCGLLVNSSRAIIYASIGEDFATQAAAEARKVQTEMAILLNQYNIG